VVGVQEIRQPARLEPDPTEEALRGQERLEPQQRRGGDETRLEDVLGDGIEAEGEPIPGRRACHGPRLGTCLPGHQPPEGTADRASCRSDRLDDLRWPYRG